MLPDDNVSRMYNPCSAFAVAAQVSHMSAGHASQRDGLPVRGGASTDEGTAAAWGPATQCAQNVVKDSDYHMLQHCTCLRAAVFPTSRILTQALPQTSACRCCFNACHLQGFDWHLALEAAVESPSAKLSDGHQLRVDCHLGPGGTPREQ